MDKVWGFIVSFLLVVASLYGVYKFTDVSGNVFMDWSVGTLSALWLLLVVTVPWNAYFRAKEVLHDAEVSKQNDIVVKEEDLKFTRKVSKLSLLLAIFLHIASAIGLFFVAHLEISVVGYYTAVLAILLTLFRPSIRFYEYIQRRLRSIKNEFRYPRDDINKTLSQVEDLLQRIEQLEETLSDKKESWKVKIETNMQINKQSIDDISMNIATSKKEQELSQKEEQLKLQKELEKIREESQDIVSKIVENSEVVKSIKTLGSFFKNM